MKIVAIIPNESEDASSWWRIKRPLAMLRTLGHQTSWFAYDKMDKDDVEGAIVVIHRIVPGNPKKYVRDLKSRGAKRIVYSIDDYTTNADEFGNYLAACGGMTRGELERVLKGIPRQIETIDLCDAFITSTGNLYDKIYQQVSTSGHILENAIDETWFKEYLALLPQTQNKVDKLFIGWAGGRRPEADLLSMSEAWGRIAREPKYDHVSFVVGGWEPDSVYRHVPMDRIVRKPWAILEEWPQLMQVDIGCCPLADTEFNRCKSPIKFQEYTLAGAAVVTSPIMYDEYITDRYQGLIVKNDDWYDALTFLIEEKGYRESMQERAEYNIHNYVTLQANIDLWQTAFDTIMS